MSETTERQQSEEKTIVDEPTIKEEVEDESDEGTIVPKEEREESLVSELLSDDDIEMEDV